MVKLCAILKPAQPAKQGIFRECQFILTKQCSRAKFILDGVVDSKKPNKGSLPLLELAAASVKLLSIIQYLPGQWTDRFMNN